jgi:hypothetical protein
VCLLRVSCRGLALGLLGVVGTLILGLGVQRWVLRVSGQGVMGEGFRSRCHASSSVSSVCHRPALNLAPKPYTVHIRLLRPPGASAGG